MRSYYAHLETQKESSNLKINSKPTFRSSAIFPIFHEKDISSRILFMGYWILKRNIRELTALISLRSENGSLLGRSQLAVTEPKCYRIESSQLLEQSGHDMSIPFKGSLEIEFFSLVNLVFPFPAVVINYYGPRFSTVVHTAQRVYNDVEDMLRNSQVEVPESGFNIYANNDREPFIGLINGSIPVEDSRMLLTFFSKGDETLTTEIDLGKLNAYETRILYPGRLVDLKSFLKGQAGSAKATFNVSWIFPRLVVGNFLPALPALGITHTYYDCIKADSKGDYWLSPVEGWYPASLMVPAVLQNTHYTNINFYPIYSPSNLTIDIEIYDSTGKKLGSQQDVLILKPPLKNLQVIELKTICKELKIDTEQPLASRIITRTLGSCQPPTRIKIGFDIGQSPKALPCNICTNLHPFNPDLDNKPHTFRWAPVLADQPQASLWVLNSSPKIAYTRDAEVNLTFFRESDASTFTRTLIIPPNGFRSIQLDADPELKAFFQGKVGWVTARTTNPYTTTFYFSENPSGIVGGDHGF